MKRHPNFSGGAIEASHGYKLVYVGKDHHLADCRGYAYEHRVIMEKKLGRKLAPGEVVHHKNEVKSDNHPDNLEVKPSNAAHLNGHRRVGLSRKTHDEGNPEITCACGCGGKLPKFDKYNRPRLFMTGHNHRGKPRAWSTKKGARSNP